MQPYIYISRIHTPGSRGHSPSSTLLDVDERRTNFEIQNREHVNVPNTSQNGIRYEQIAIISTAGVELLVGRCTRRWTLHQRSASRSDLSGIGVVGDSLRHSERKFDRFYVFTVVTWCVDLSKIADIAVTDTLVDNIREFPSYKITKPIYRNNYVTTLR